MMLTVTVCQGPFVSKQASSFFISLEWNTLTIMCVYTALYCTDQGLVDMGELTYEQALLSCPYGKQLPIVRTQSQLERIQTLIGPTSNSFTYAYLFMKH